VNATIAPRRRRYRSPLAELHPGRIGILIGLTAFFVFFLTASGLSRLLGAGVLALIVFSILWRWPFGGLLALIVVGTIHPFLMMLVYHFSGSVFVLKASQIWKEVVMLVLLLKALEGVLRRRGSPTISLLDLAIFSFFAFGALYLVYPGINEDATFFSRALGLRADASFLLAYFIARGAELNRKQVRTLMTAFAVMAFVIAIVAAAQFMAPEWFNAAFDRLGFAEFMQVQRGDQAVQVAVRDRGISGVNLPRASSLLLSDLALAFFALLAAPLALSLLVTMSGIGSQALALVLVFATVGTTFLTVTRSAIVGLAPVIPYLILKSRNFKVGLVLLILALLAGLTIAALAGVTPQTLGNIFSPDEASVQGHIQAIEDSLEIVAEEPLGRGLGTAGQVAQRLKPQGAITNESWYLQIATEIGVIPALIFIFINLGFAHTAFRRYRQVQATWLKALCLGMGGAAIAFGLVGVTLHVWEGLTISIIFWFFAGLVVRARDFETNGESGLNANRSLA
jgi:hypothetical protein